MWESGGLQSNRSARKRQRNIQSLLIRLGFESAISVYRSQCERRVGSSQGLLAERNLKQRKLVNRLLGACGANLQVHHFLFSACPPPRTGIDPSVIKLVTLMASNHASLDAASNERKARLAKLASLKRKQPEPDGPESGTPELTKETHEIKLPVSHQYFSGRNYDVITKGPKLGFENNPSANVKTLEAQASNIAKTTAERAAEDEIAAQAGLDLFKLQPKKPNWDLKRDLDEKMKILNVRTENAIARLVRERIQNAKKVANQTGPKAADGDTGEEVGIEGNALVEGLHLREKEEEEERRQLEAEERDGAV